MSKKNTRNALMMSALALLLCVSMLVGTTFAWFTDSVQSGTNTITAGNLDVQLFHADKGGSGEVGSTTKLFDDVKLWEPGAMVYEKLTVENNGSLALKYALTVSISEISEVNGKSLADVLKIAVMDEMPTRENIKTAATQNLTTFQRNGTLLANGDRDTYYVAIYWAPSANDNDYNVAGEALKATLGVNLVATQMTKEEDSFNNQYDKDATYPVLASKDIDNTTTDRTIVVDDVEVSVPQNAPDGMYTLSISYKALDTDPVSGAITVDYDIDLLKDGEKVSTPGMVYDVVIRVPAGATVSAVKHNDEDILYSYNMASGEISFNTDSFSPYSVTYKTNSFVACVDEVGFETLDEAVAYVKENGGTLALLRSFDNSLTFEQPEDGANTEITLDLNGYTLSSDVSTLCAADGYHVTIRDSVGTGKLLTTTAGKVAIAVRRNGKVTLESGYVAGVSYAVYLYGEGDNNTFVMNGGTIYIPNGGSYALGVGNGSATINGGNVICDKVSGGGGWSIYSWGTTVINGGHVKGVPNGAATDNLSITSGTFTFGDAEDTLNTKFVTSGSFPRIYDDGTVIVESNTVTGLSGTGTEEDPYLIQNVYDLLWFRDHVNTCAQDGSSQYTGKYIKLTADIDLKGIAWEPIGSTVKDHGSFNGTFDGDGHTISNLYVNVYDPGNAQEMAGGFFAKTSGGGDGPQATIKNITFHNVDVSTTDKYAGGVIGNAGGNTVISNIKLTGDVYVSGFGYVGGIVGHGYTDMYNCSVEANEGSYIHGTGFWCVGGIIGYAGENGTYIKDCSVSGVEIWSAQGGAGAVAGFLQAGNKLENVHAQDVEVTSSSDYVMGHISGNGEESTYVNVTMKNVTATANGAPITNTDNANITVLD